MLKNVNTYIIRLSHEANKSVLYSRTANPKAWANQVVLLV